MSIQLFFRFCFSSNFHSYKRSFVRSFCYGIEKTSLDIIENSCFLQKNKIELRDNVNEIEFIHHRLQLFDKIYERQCKERGEKVSEMISIRMPDSSVREVESFKVSPFEIAREISISLSKRVIVAVVNDEMWDLTRVLEYDCSLELLTFDDERAKEVFWHSSSHVLGESMERMLKGKLTIGPALPSAQLLPNGGFYYDVSTELMLSPMYYESLEDCIKKIIKEKQEFNRILMSKSEALEMFKFNKFKLEIIEDIYLREENEESVRCSAYRCGSLIDLCRGPHIPHTGLIKALKIKKNGATNWKNRSDGEFLQRLYGVSFPEKRMMTEYLALCKKAAENDHRAVGKRQDLFFFHDLSPGSCFWLPHGTRIYNKLIAFVREEYRERGFTEVITPNVFNFDLWKTSGHAQLYEPHMFIFGVESQKCGLKPMNCPGHCLMYKHTLRSYRDLPIRYADFGVLHRNEDSGSLTGLTRVRRFVQDDAHIFCRNDQIQEEISNCLAFLKHVYGVFKFEFTLELSTKPDKALGEDHMWQKAEAQLAASLDKFVLQNSSYSWKINPGDGAFYGPKIDIKVYDSLHRQHQCATIQLDFNLPERFQLEYIPAKNQNNNDEVVRPVIIHRAIYGSLERFIGILTEHLGGKWPFWLSPRQLCVIPVTHKYDDYAKAVNDQLHSCGYWIDVDLSNNRLNKKIRNAQIAQYNFILVVGEKEEEGKTVNIRTRDNKNHGTKSIQELVDWLKELERNYQ